MLECLIIGFLKIIFINLDQQPLKHDINNSPNNSLIIISPERSRAAQILEQSFEMLRPQTPPPSSSSSQQRPFTFHQQQASVDSSVFTPINERSMSSLPIHFSSTPSNRLHRMAQVEQDQVSYVGVARDDVPTTSRQAQFMAQQGVTASSSSYIDVLDNYGRSPIRTRLLYDQSPGQSPYGGDMTTEVSAQSQEEQFMPLDNDNTLIESVPEASSSPLAGPSNQNPQQLRRSKRTQPRRGLFR